MATTDEDFIEILNAEQQVDLDRLRQAAWHGIPDSVRGHVWTYLLGVKKADKSHEHQRLEELSDNEAQFVVKRLRGEINRYCQNRKQLIIQQSAITDFEHTLLRIISTHLNQHLDSPFSSTFVYLCGPFVYCIHDEEEGYQAFEKLLSMLEMWQQTRDLNDRLSHFLMLFRSLIPDLYQTFLDEEISFKELATSWFEYLLSKQLPLECVLRLWDTYFSSPDGLSLHPYVCLALLSYLKDEIEDMDFSEIHTLLQRLPMVDMDKIISHALRFKYECMERGMSDLL
ncbi:rab-GTPase-TBC domain-containing protein [Gorgonomyces haynaldii]|nr:rab-GTPase-TBC domain-containing protein [Gorgonomyces haynaldii]